MYFETPCSFRCRKYLIGYILNGKVFISNHSRRSLEDGNSPRCEEEGCISAHARSGSARDCRFFRPCCSVVVAALLPSQISVLENSMHSNYYLTTHTHTLPIKHGRSRQMA
ncbi:hypothetical protein OBBRIDRAFT_549845 [Obba rivulosa]|uniref:Uncharacterized protein n=1 Tax=Obba rivulosa TaxID=1052685 RepID=A0A8E2B430_9APHY|nr:hypothetical protein OBBRIDRAFT_549845 [Obba rivulosa]